MTTLYVTGGRRCLAEIELEDYGLHAVFSSLPAGPAAPTWNPMNGEIP